MKLLSKALKLWSAALLFHISECNGLLPGLNLRDWLTLKQGDCRTTPCKLSNVNKYLCTNGKSSYFPSLDSLHFTVIKNSIYLLKCWKKALQISFQHLTGFKHNLQKWHLNKLVRKLSMSQKILCFLNDLLHKLIGFYLSVVHIISLFCGSIRT